VLDRALEKQKNNKKNQDLQLGWRQSIRESRNENDRLLSLLELLTEKIRSELHDNLGAKKAALKQFKMGNRSFHTYTRDKLKPRIFQEESAKQFFDWKSKMNVLIRQARKFLSGYCTQVTALQLSVDRMSTLQPKLLAARGAVQKSSKRTSVADMKRRTRILDNLQDEMASALKLTRAVRSEICGLCFGDNQQCPTEILANSRLVNDESPDCSTLCGCPVQLEFVMAEKTESRTPQFIDQIWLQAYQDRKYIKQAIVDQTKLDPKLIEVRCVKVVDKRLKILALMCTKRGDKTTNYIEKAKGCSNVTKDQRLKSTFKAGYDDGYNKDRLGLFEVKDFLIKKTRAHKHISMVSHGKCGCILHKFCIERWLAEYNTVCPNCKKPWKEVRVEKTC